MHLDDHDVCKRLDLIVNMLAYLSLILSIHLLASWMRILAAN